MQRIKKYLKTNNITNCDLIFYFVLFSIFLFTRLYKLVTIPHGMNFDEMSMGYNVWSLTEFGVDRYNNPYPIYFNNSGSGMSCLYIYIAVLLSKIFGYNVFILRVVAVLFGINLLIFGTKTAYKIQGKQFAKIVAVLLTTLPFFIMSERFAYDCYAMVSMFVMTFYFFLQMIDTGKLRYAVLTGLGVSLTLYSYALAYIIVPIFIVLALIYLICTKKFSIRNIIVTASIVILTSSPLVYFGLVLLEIVPMLKTKFLTISDASIFRKHEVQFTGKGFRDILSDFNTLLTNDKFDFTSAGKGVIYDNRLHILGYSISFEVIIFTIALGVFFYRLYKNKGKRFLVLAYGLSSVSILFLLSNVVNYRFNAFYFFVVFIIADLIDFLISKKFIICTYLLIGVLSVNFITFSNDLLFNESTKCFDMFDSDIADVCDYIKENDGFRDYTIYMDDTAGFNVSIAVLYGMRFTPEEYSKSVNTIYDYEKSFANFKFGVPNIEKGKSLSKGIYILRDYTPGTKIYVNIIRDKVSTDENIRRKQELISYFNKNKIKGMSVSNYSIYCVN